LRETDRDRQTETDRDRQRQTETDRDRQRQTEGRRKREREKERKTESKISLKLNHRKTFDAKKEKQTKRECKTERFNKILNLDQMKLQQNFKLTSIETFLHFGQSGS